MRSIAPVLLLFFAIAVPVVVHAHQGAHERIDILTKRIEAQPEAQQPYVARGAIHSHEGDYELALADFRKAEKLGEPFLVAYELGLLHRRMGKLDLALHYLDTFLERVPSAWPALEQRAHVLAELGRTDEAITAFEKVFVAEPNPNPGLYISAAQLLLSKDEAGLDPAIDLLDRGMARLGVLPQLQQYAIELELSHGREAKALARLESLGPVLDEGPEWKVDMGELLLRMERPEEAKAYLEAASRQLATLRATPARRELLERIATIQAATSKGE